MKKRPQKKSKTKIYQQKLRSLFKKSSNNENDEKKMKNINQKDNQFVEFNEQAKHLENIEKSRNSGLF